METSCIERSGTVHVPLSMEEASPLFTPKGARAGVEGWSPSYPEGGRPELTRGLAMEVGKEEGASTWMVAPMLALFNPPATREARHVRRIYGEAGNGPAASAGPDEAKGCGGANG